MCERLLLPTGRKAWLIPPAKPPFNLFNDDADEIKMLPRLNINCLNIADS